MKRVLTHAKQRLQTLELEGDAVLDIPSSNKIKNDFDIDELDEPYTQDWGGGSDDDEDDIYASAITLEPSRKKEPIRPGDVISYYSHVFVSGDKRGLRTATVLSVDAKGDPVLKLSNGEYLPKDTQIKRIKIIMNGVLEDHKGIYRPIDYFKLRTNKNAKIVVETERQRLDKILKNKMKNLKDKIEQEGDKSLPSDFLHCCSDTERNANGDAELSEKTRKRRMEYVEHSPICKSPVSKRQWISKGSQQSSIKKETKKCNIGARRKQNKSWSPAEKLEFSSKLYHCDGFDEDKINTSSTNENDSINSDKSDTVRTSERDLLTPGNLAVSIGSKSKFTKKRLCA